MGKGFLVLVPIRWAGVGGGWMGPSTRLNTVAEVKILAPAWNRTVTLNLSANSFLPETEQISSMWCNLHKILYLTIFFTV
jgi:hypothetical protein